MDASILTLSLKKQREINRTLQRKLRAETMLTSALSSLVWHRKEQSEFALEKVRRALELKNQVNGGAAMTSFYPTGKRKSA
jgi:hypothetical protein